MPVGGFYTWEGSSFTARGLGEKGLVPAARDRKRLELRVGVYLREISSRIPIKMVRTEGTVVPLAAQSSRHAKKKNPPSRKGERVPCSAAHGTLIPLRFDFVVTDN
jgi:hypothetical protein